ncbi:cell adhesion molecule DSCAM-like [Mytilus edulis]|uniref:cell adhesion molecule DSCAM-like n=1 Tax=Mytilus edulis TaxID=6550 RepID=UPI0039F08CCF
MRFIKNVFVNKNGTICLNCTCFSQSESSWRVLKTSTEIKLGVTEREQFYIPYNQGLLLNPKLKNSNINISGDYESGECNLIITHFSAADTGTYKCEYWESGCIKIDTYNVYLQSPPSDLKIQHTTDIDGKKILFGNEGLAITIVCTVKSGKPEETLVLQTNGSTLKTGGNGSLEHSFVPTRKNNRQSFKCSAISEILDNPLVYTVELDIQYKPEIVIDKINPETLVEGNFTKICCQAKSNPKAMTIEWKKNGESVLTGYESRLCLEFTALNRSHTGRYTCKATNTVGPTKQSVFYKVLYPPVIHITRLPKEQKIILTCNPRGEPNNYTFADWAHLSEFKEYIRRLRGTKDGKLTIFKAGNMSRRHENDGIYTCKSTNGILDVHRELYQEGTIPINDEGPPIFVKANKPIQFGQYRQEINLTVFLYNKFGSIQTNITKENKMLNIQTTEEKIVTNDVFHNVNVSVNGIKITFKIVLDKAEDFNDYTITACNQKGCNEYMVMIKSASRPEPPSNVSVLPYETYLEVSWCPGFDGGFSQTFVIEYKTETEEMWKQTEPVTDNMQHTMKVRLYDISPNTRYYVQILSKNRIGQCIRNETDFTLVLSLGLSTHGYAVTVVAIVVPIIFILVLTIVMRVIVFIRNKAKDIAGFTNDRDDETAANLQGDSVENQLYQSSSFQNSAAVHHVLIQNETYQNLPALSNDNQTHQMRLYNGNGANGQGVSNSNRGVLSPVHGLEIGESSLQYAEVTFQDQPITQEVVIHGIADRTIYSDIDFMTQYEAQPCGRSKSDSESDDDFMYVDGIENFVEKRGNNNS